MRKNKRIFFACVALLTVMGLTAAPAAAQGGGGGGGGGGVIDPPTGAPFKDPENLPNLSGTTGVFEGYLQAIPAQVNVNGVMANLFTYNGLYPGPTIRVNHNDILKLHFTNSLPATTTKNILGYEKNHTNLHTHGLHVSPEEPADAVHLDIAPGQTYHYQYDLSKQPGGTLNFLHGHVHGLTAEQYWGGMLSAIIVADEVSALAAYETHTMILKDITLSGTQPEPYGSMMDFTQGKEGNIIMVNGQVNPVLPSKPGQVQRWQVLNGSNARYYKLSLEGHIIHVVGTDGGLLDKPYSLSSVLLAPGERVDILVKASAKKGSYKLLSLPYARRGNMSSAQITLLTMSCQGSAAGGVMPASINPSAVRLNMDVSMLPKKTLILSMGQGNAYINGQDFDVDPYDIHSTYPPTCLL